MWYLLSAKSIFRVILADGLIPADVNIIKNHLEVARRAPVGTPEKPLDAAQQQAVDGTTELIKQDATQLRDNLDLSKAGATDLKKQLDAALAPPPNLKALADAVDAAVNSQCLKLQASSETVSMPTAVDSAAQAIIDKMKSDPVGPSQTLSSNVTGAPDEKARARQEAMLKLLPAPVDLGSSRGIGTSDGYNGPKTEAAIKKLQEQLGIQPATGKWDGVTEQKVLEALARITAGSDPDATSQVNTPTKVDTPVQVDTSALEQEFGALQGRVAKDGQDYASAATQVQQGLKDASTITEPDKKLAKIGEAEQQLGNARTAAGKLDLDVKDLQALREKVAALPDSPQRTSLLQKIDGEIEKAKLTPPLDAMSTEVEDAKKLAQKQVEEAKQRELQEARRAASEEYLKVSNNWQAARDGAQNITKKAVGTFDEDIPDQALTDIKTPVKDVLESALKLQQLSARYPDDQDLKEKAAYAKQRASEVMSAFNGAAEKYWEYNTQGTLDGMRASSQAAHQRDYAQRLRSNYQDVEALIRQINPTYNRPDALNTALSH